MIAVAIGRMFCGHQDALLSVNIVNSHRPLRTEPRRGCGGGAAVAATHGRTRGTWTRARTRWRPKGRWRPARRRPPRPPARSAACSRRRRPMTWPRHPSEKRKRDIIVLRCIVNVSTLCQKKHLQLTAAAPAAAVIKFYTPSRRRAAGN